MGQLWMALRRLQRNLEGLFSSADIHLRMLCTDINELFHSMARAARSGGMMTWVEFLADFGRIVQEIDKRLSAMGYSQPLTSERSYQEPDGLEVHPRVGGDIQIPKWAVTSTPSLGRISPRHWALVQAARLPMKREGNATVRARTCKSMAGSCNRKVWEAEKRKLSAAALPETKEAEAIPRGPSMVLLVRVQDLSSPSVRFESAEHGVVAVCRLVDPVKRVVEILRADSSGVYLASGTFDSILEVAEVVEVEFDDDEPVTFTPEELAMVREPDGQADDSDPPTEHWAACDKCDKSRVTNGPWDERRRTFTCRSVGKHCSDQCDCEDQDPDWDGSCLCPADALVC
jgi:hypothetical protein